MTPQERQLVADLFDRLASVENTARDADAERAIADGLQRAPHALYALVQTVLVQDEALKRADARIQELTGEDGNAQARTSFLDNMRNALGGRASVPNVSLTTHQTADEPDTRWNQGAVLGGGPAVAANAPAQQNSGGGSFLGTAAASAAGAIGGALLLNSLSSMFGHHGGGSAFAAAPPSSPWDNSSSSSATSDLARDAGLNDIGSTHSDLHDAAKSVGLFDTDNPDGNDVGFDDTDDFDGDFGGDDST